MSSVVWFHSLNISAFNKILHFISLSILHTRVSLSCTCNHGVFWVEVTSNIPFELSKKNLTSYPCIHFCGLSFDLFVFWLNEDGEG